MNGIGNITERILTDARLEAEEVLRKAEAQAAEVRAAGEKAAQEEYWRRIREGARACEAREARLQKTAEMESKKGVLALKQELLSAAFDRALERLTAMPAAEKTAFLARLACRASSGGGEAVCLCAADRDAVGEAVTAEANRLLKGAGKPAGLTLDPAGAPIRGGLLLKKGSITVNCSAETLVEGLRSSMAGEVAAMLFD